ncbi:MAG: metalloregulator ArsR/SmtB family transcription factor [Candidatus Bathyarchaeota archaeon]|nr:metalloregulator ArsR/SmtB family transcription factor [Candidatus Bathyarchaeota archaeon]
MKQGLNEICYGFFATLANPTRLAILERLQDGAMNVSGLAMLLDQEQSMISHNLKLLERCGFIESQRKGKEKYVYLNEALVGPLFELVQRHASDRCGVVDDCPYDV